MTADDFFNYLPPFYRNVDVFNLVFSAVASKLNKIETEFIQRIANHFIYSEDISEDGVDRLGKSLKIDLSGFDFDDKIFKIKTVLYEKRPYNRVNVRTMLSSLCGENNYSVEFDAVNKIVSVKVNLGKKKQFSAMYELLDNVLPADMVLNIELLYNLHGDLTGMTHGELSAMTHDELRSEVLK